MHQCMYLFCDLGILANLQSLYMSYQMTRPSHTPVVTAVFGIQTRCLIIGCTDAVIAENINKVCMYMY